MSIFHVILDNDSNCIKYHSVQLNIMAKSVSEDPKALESFEKGFLPGKDPLFKLLYFSGVTRHAGGHLF